jgi:hypothetical protein
MLVRHDVQVILWLLAAASALFGCSTLLGLGDYSVTSDEGGAAAPDAIASEGAVNTYANDGAVTVHEASVVAPEAGVCNLDPRSHCYPCAPTTQVQFLNACTSGTCVAFDDSQRLANLLPDGALPPLPTASTNDAGGP